MRGETNLPIRKRDDSHITELWVSQQSEMTSPEEAGSDQLHVGLSGDGILTPTGHWEYWDTFNINPDICTFFFMFTNEEQHPV